MRKLTASRIETYEWASHKVRLPNGYTMYFASIDDVREWIRMFKVKDAEIMELRHGA